MASSKKAAPKSDDIAIDMRRFERPEEQKSALKSPEDKLSRTDPCKELNHIMKGTGSTSSGAESRPQIQKVPRILRENEKNKTNYDPKLVSIGPYHYGDSKLELGQTLKAKLLQQFNLGKNESLEAYLHSKDFGKVAHEARNSYAKSATDLFDEEAFKCLMFLDGCFVAYFIYYIVKNPKDVQMKTDHKAIITMDLFLLENQLPYAVLHALMASEFLPTKEDDIKAFIEMQTAAKGSEGKRSPLYQRCLELCPFLKKGRGPLLYQWFLEHCPLLKKGRKSNDTTTAASALEMKQPLHLLDFLRTEFGGNTVEFQQQYRRSVNDWQSFRSVDDLKAAGIKCVTSNSSCVKKIEFQPFRCGFYAHLLLPAILIDDSFKTKWLNLAAYEACPDFKNDGAITSFICFMDSLIDDPKDVKELREQGILQNSLGSDQKVAELFNDLATDLTPNPLEYQQVKRGIEKRFQNSWGIWVTAFLHTHFSSPWTIFAFLAAIMGLIFTGIQAYSRLFPRNS